MFFQKSMSFSNSSEAHKLNNVSTFTEEEKIIHQIQYERCTGQNLKYLQNIGIFSRGK